MKLCELCHVRRATNVHHKLPRSRGGRDDEFNTAQLCGAGTTGCHGWVHANPAEARQRGLTVSGYMILDGYQGPNEDYAVHYGRPPC